MTTLRLFTTDTEIVYDNTVVVITKSMIHGTQCDIDKNNEMTVDLNKFELIVGDDIKPVQIASILLDNLVYCKILLDKPANKKYCDIFAANMVCIVYCPEISDISDLMQGNNVVISVIGKYLMDNKWLKDIEFEIDLMNFDVKLNDTKIGSIKSIQLI